ncbi:hypothetical protein B0T24DRAFT_212125 [Lasiosphaeria ovina]|uniref:Uncharacterized protein n=1 Tax=Lasiosphaeria ovina TaxID=92902 RepID=A0AAE0N9Q5_9PEZI|nr:hypothetical protein B0T24DRAFT_212125 [Lasiosphaeria ovina]
MCGVWVTSYLAGLTASSTQLDNNMVVLLLMETMEASHRFNIDSGLKGIARLLESHSRESIVLEFAIFVGLIPVSKDDNGGAHSSRRSPKTQIPTVPGCPFTLLLSSPTAAQATFYSCAWVVTVVTYHPPHNIASAYGRLGELYLASENQRRCCLSRIDPGV